jgi:hypothetical protein
MHSSPGYQGENGWQTSGSQVDSLQGDGQQENKHGSGCRHGHSFQETDPWEGEWQVASMMENEKTTALAASRPLSK